MPTRTTWYVDADRLEDDIREHARSAVGGYADRADLTAPDCDDSTLRLLRSLHRIERSTIEWMRVLLVTPTHSDAQVTAFLCTWAYERHWSAAALATVLDHHGRPPRPEPVEGLPPILHRARRTMAKLWDGLVPITEALRTNLIGDSVVAAHLVEGLVSEVMISHAYRRLIMIEPSLTELLTAILATKINHRRYFRTRAIVDLAASRSAQRRVRGRLRRLRWPSRISGLPEAELDRFVEAMFPADSLARIEPELAGLPGVARIRPVVDRSRLRFRTGKS